MSKRTKACPWCGEHFSYETPVGRNKTYCSETCRERHKVYRRKTDPSCSSECASEGCNNLAVTRRLCQKCYTAERKRTAGECQVHKCHNPALRDDGTLCEKHYYRVRRTGTHEKRKPLERYLTGAGYSRVKAPGHPLAAKDGTVFEHRLVKYRALGEGNHPCFWCGELVSWSDAVVDHLNEVKDDNRPENLVYSCNNCNRARGAVLPFIERLSEQSLDAFIEQARAHWARTRRTEDDDEQAA